MVRVALGPERKKAAQEAAADETFDRSVKVVAGARNHRQLTLQCVV